MYSRRLGDKTYTFEPSGGLLNASLVMMDRETDSHWSIITEEAIWGEAQGTALEQIPGAVKTTWGNWRALHPSTMVLSVADQEHNPKDYYAEYFSDDSKTFFDLKAANAKLPDKAQIYAFHWNDGAFAVPHSSVTGGGVVQVGDREIFLYRAAGDSSYQSTRAFISAPGEKFEKAGDTWKINGASWSSTSRRFEGDPSPETFHGFDTFWYIWSLTNDTTELLPAS